LKKIDKKPSAEAMAALYPPKHEARQRTVHRSAEREGGT
jgi:hypothetical protein